MYVMSERQWSFIKLFSENRPDPVGNWTKLAKTCACFW